MKAWNELNAKDAIAAVAEGGTGVETIVAATLARIAQRQAEVQAYAFVDATIALRQAKRASGPLAGMTLAVKDVFATADQPTQYHSNLYRGHRPAEDAAAVAILRAAGAVVIGKTDTHEFAGAGRLLAARHPLDPARTPGGSSSGSAAAVADHQAQVALGTQTAGSTIRPAAFCGVVGFKPTFGVVSTEGAKPHAAALDTVGLFARTVDDVALTALHLGVSRRETPAPPRKLSDLRIGLCRTAHWAKADQDTKSALERAAAALRLSGVRVFDLDLPASFTALTELQTALMRAEGRAGFLALDRVHEDALHPDFRARVANADGTTRAELRRMVDALAAARPVFDDLAGGVDALMTPAAVGEAPVGEATGDPLFNRLWSALHVPAITLPGFRGDEGLPIGIQFVAPRWFDDELIETARVVAPVIARGGTQPG